MKNIYLFVFAIFFTVCLSTFAMQNPWIECGDDISCGAQKAGFNFPLMVDNYSVRAMDGMMEISFHIDNKRIVTARKAQVFNGPILTNGIVDISGNYNKYKVNKTTYLKNGIPFWTRGEKKKFYVAAFAAESGFYSFYCKQGLSKNDLVHIYKLIAEAEAPRLNYDEAETLTIEQLQDLRRIDGIVEPVYTQDGMPEILKKRGVTNQCFERANLNQDTYCSASELKLLKNYYIK
ncbi:MAG: hypothetical protein MJ237_06685 [bacterium]|nr:hypothetical protein [bacterium]